MKREYHVLSLGAGVQSTFLYLAWSKLGLANLDAAVFADTQEEPAAVYQHLEWLKSLDRAPILVGSAGKLGEHLKTGTNGHGGRFSSIPAYTFDGIEKAHTPRQCSRDYKVHVIRKVIRHHILNLADGRAVPRGTTVHQYLGISMDEAGRAYRIERVPDARYLVKHFPLVDQFITRKHCLQWLESRVPHQVPRSACVFCPFHSDAEWLKIKSVPEDWQRAVEIDEALRTTGSVANRNMKQTMYLHRSMQPLIQIDFQTRKNPLEAQSNFNFAPECLGVCGV